MQTVTVTRMELLARKEQIELAGQGLEMLKQKRSALLRELMQVAERVLAESDVLQGAAAHARRSLARAEARAGARPGPVIEQKRASRSVLGRGYAISGTSVTIDEAAMAFEAEVNSLIELAESELRLKRLADEIQRTSRRANALEHVVLPRLKSECRYIEMALHERERADHFRLKLVKRGRQRKAGE